jgi:GntR family transcriptional regulator
MRLWLNRIGEVSLREQLMTQVVLGILCREILPGQRLPSTRDLARRFGIHANTASAAYRQLEREGWVEFHHGSGVFVCGSRPPAPLTPELAVDQLIGDLAAKTRKLGAPESLLRARLRRWLACEPPARWLLIDPDPELRRIVTCEMEKSLGLPVSGCTLEQCAQDGFLEGAMPVVLPSKATKVRTLLPPGAELAVLQVHPVAPALGGYLPAPAGVLVGIASRWKDFQRIAQTMLIAAGFAPESLLVRDASRASWKRGLQQAAVVVCDVATEPELPAGCHPIVFRLLADASIAQLRTMENSLAKAGPPPSSVSL